MSYTPIRSEETVITFPEGGLELEMETIHKRAPLDKNGALSDQDTDGDADTMELIAPDSRPDDPDVYDSYEDVLKLVGVGPAHLLLLIACGVGLSSDAVEVLSIAFTLPMLNRLPSDFGVSDVETGALSAIIFVGMLVGGYVWGGLSDISGRRPTIITSLVVNGAFGFLSAFSANFYMLLVFRFFSGVGVGGSLPVIFPYISEFMQSRYRGPYMGLLAPFWMVGAITCASAALLLLPPQYNLGTLGSINFYNWRVFLMVCSLPSLLGALLFFFLPESPRFLLEVGKEVEALRILRRVHRLNHLRRDFTSPPFNVKGIKLAEVMESSVAIGGTGCRQPVAAIYRFPARAKEILRRTLQLYKRALIRPTLLLMVTHFALSYGSYGVTLWYPSYVDQLTQQSQRNDFQCHSNISDVTYNDSALFCNCPSATYNNVAFDLNTTSPWQLTNSVIASSDIAGVYWWVWFENVTLTDIRFNDTSITNGSFINSTWEEVYLNNVNFTNTTFCNITMTGEPSFDEGDVRFINSTFNGQSLNGLSTAEISKLFAANANVSSSCARQGKTLSLDSSCSTPDEVDYFTEYLHDLFISAAALPGNIMSAILMYFFIRSFWLSTSLALSATSVLLLFIVHGEVFAVVMLCLFKAITIPAWNMSSLINAEVYPTSLRTTASGVHLLVARIGAIFGTFVFGAFSSSSEVFVPILMAAGIIAVGAVAAIFLPKTTRKTPLK